MIFVTLGTHPQPFSRLIDMLREVPLVAPVIVQYGATPPADIGVDTTWTQWLPYEGVVRAMGEADAVVAHSGLGTIMTAIGAGCRPIVVPRRRDQNEHVDDHQVEIARRLERDGRLVVASTSSELAAAVAAAHTARPQPAARGRLASLIGESVLGAA